MTEINLWLDSYDDLYSDFDSRQYEKRRVSEDFLQELRTEIRFKKNSPGNMILLLPSDKRNEKTEKIIAGSLSAFFKSRYLYFTGKYRNKMRSGFLLFVAGAIMMLISSWVSYSSAGSWSTTLLIIILEPAGWFLVWAAFDFLFFDLSSLKKEKKLFDQLSRLNIHFNPS